MRWMTWRAISGRPYRERGGGGGGGGGRRGGRGRKARALLQPTDTVEMDVEFEIDTAEETAEEAVEAEAEEAARCKAAMEGALEDGSISSAIEVWPHRYCPPRHTHAVRTIVP